MVDCTNARYDVFSDKGPCSWRSKAVFHGGRHSVTFMQFTIVNLNVSVITFGETEFSKSHSVAYMLDFDE